VHEGTSAMSDPPRKARAWGGAPPPTGKFAVEGGAVNESVAAAWRDYGTSSAQAVHSTANPYAAVDVDRGDFASGQPGSPGVQEWGVRPATIALSPTPPPPPPDVGADKAPPPPAPPKPVPWVCVFILLGCCAGLTYSMYITPGIIAPLAQNPMIGPTASSLVTAGAKITCLITPPSNQWWRLVAPMWLHAGLIHIGCNMNMLRQVGVQMERGAGSLRFAAIYVAGGVLSMVGSALFSSASVTVGASGALFGLLGAYLAELISNCHLMTAREGLCAFASLGFSIAINLAIGLVPLVDNFAHLSGLVGGLCAGFALLIHVDEKGHVRANQVALAAAALIAYILLLSAGVALLYFNILGQSFCPACRYISCVPTPWWSCDSDVASDELCQVL
jgi:membrane associated rhomboid family serine protease